RVGGTRPVPVDVRILCASHCDLDALAKTGRFRADLFYRLSVLRLKIPPLREREGDVAALAEWHLKHALAALGTRPHANLHAEIQACVPLLEGYAWPGNVRELRNVMERLALFLAAEPLQALTPSFLLAAAPELKEKGFPTGEAATESAARVLARFNGNRQAAANYLGISRTTLWRKLKEEQL
ncbi:MAG TPA: helix-turn-helix domain-containing protein, partial [Burkholderiaceae bacterium]